MNEDQKSGAVIVVVAVTLIAALLVLSNGWGIDGVPLHLYSWWSEVGSPGSPDYDYGDRYISTKYFVTPLLFIVGYGMARYFSIIPPIFRKK